jgi:endonuclease G
MTAPQNRLAFDPDVLDAATRNWESRERVRNKAARSARKYTIIESPDRLAKRANRLLDQVRRASDKRPGALSPELRDLVEREPIRPEEMDDVLMERIIGATRDFLSAAFMDRGVEAMRSVGRIVVPAGDGLVAYGTGFLVSPHLLLTNHHVLPDETSAAAATVEFDYQVDRFDNPLRVERFDLRPDLFFLTDRELDYALVSVTEVSRSGKPLKDYDFCPLIADEGKIVVKNCVNIVQHPRGEMKQVVVRENEVVDVLENYLHYQGDTEPGSSGALVCNDQWEVVALHHSGVAAKDADGNYLDTNGGIWKPGDDPTRLKWIANEGVRVSKLMASVQAAQVRPHEEAFRKELTSPQRASASPDPAPLLPSDTQRNVLPVNRTMETMVDSSSSVSITVPLTITISLGQPASPPLGSSGQTAPSPPRGPALRSSPAEGQENTPPQSDYESRPGYDPQFLGESVPLPRLSNSIRAKAVTVPGAPRENPFELKYFHYSVMMNGDRRVALVSAVNLDGGARCKVDREGADQWFYDPRIPREKQAGPALYSSNPLDRGHLSRRADAAWGATQDEADRANSDTFHWTNCSPQHEVFNQSQKATKAHLLLWGNLENHVAEQAQAEHQRLSVFNGPVFRDDDRSYRGIQLPREFYKLIVFKRSGGGLGAAAFVLSQADLIANLPEEEFEPGEFKPFQVRLRDLESRTKLDFGALRTFDPLEDPSKESFMEAGADHVLLRDLSDIVL